MGEGAFVEELDRSLDFLNGALAPSDEQLGEGAFTREPDCNLVLAPSEGLLGGEDFAKEMDGNLNLLDGALVPFALGEGAFAKEKDRNPSERKLRGRDFAKELDCNPNLLDEVLASSALGAVAVLLFPVVDGGSSLRFPN